MEPILWALSTGVVTGAAWVAIVLFRRQQRMSVQQERLVEGLQQRIEQLERVDHRLTEVEERMDFAERIVSRAPGPAKLRQPPPGA